MADDLVIGLVSRVSKPRNIRQVSPLSIYNKTGDSPPPVSRAKYLFSLHIPVSITYFTPGIVIDVSAIFVANIHFRVLGGVVVKTFAFWPGACAAYIGQITT